MNDIVKFTDTEMQSIDKLQLGYQQSIYTLGQLELEKTDLEQQLQDLKNKRTEIFDNWKKLQQKESDILNSLSQKYGDGSLSLKDGTFKPIVK
jgi:chromosome segregation ATPase